MSARRDSLVPPAKTHTEDPGAHELESDDEHFSDAQSVPAESPRVSPVPTTRVEKVDDEPSYGEVPGTEAYKLRQDDAEPDEIAILPSEDAQPREQPAAPTPASASGPAPATVLEEAVDETTTTPPHKKHHQEDPEPDLVVKADGTVEVTSRTTEEPILLPPVSSSPLQAPAPEQPEESTADDDDFAEAGEAGEAGREDEADAQDDDFGDEFDDFAAGDDADDDFGDFDDSFQAPVAAASVPAPPPQPAAPPALPFPVPDFGGLDQEAVLRAAAPYLNGLYAPDSTTPTALPPLSSAPFLTPRSASLWAQLVAPPPLQPPDWIRSRIRRLFLVSLGVPVDLDEILPASKQKKLVLPSLSVRRDSPRTSTDSRSPAANGGSGSSGGSSGGGVARLKQQGANGSSTSVDSQGRSGGAGASRGHGGSSSSKRKGPPRAPALDLVAAQQLCATTDEALDGMTDAELQAHVARLQALEQTATVVLEFWTKRTDEKIGDREAFEGVIENLVAHARKTRK